MELKFKKVTMPTDEIKITSAFSRSMPRLSKLKTCMDFYRANGYFDRQIIINEDKYLHDGYCAYLTAKLLDVQTVRVLMVSGVEEQRNPALDSKPSTVKATKTQKQFHPGMLVKITGNVNDHRFNIGETVRLVKNTMGSQWTAEYLDEHDWWHVMECDMEQIKSVEDKTNTRSTDNTTEFTYNVGDRVMCKCHAGQVIGIDADDDGFPYLIEFDEPGVGCHNGDAFDLTVGRHGTSGNCLWCRDNDLQPIESNPKPTTMYCIKDYGKDLTKGKTYDFDGGIISYDDGRRSFGKYKSFDEWKRRNPTFSACLVPLVGRSAKVGEWIYVITDNGGCVKAGTIWKVTNVDSERVYLMGNYVCSLNNYLVLDGYMGEKEREGLSDAGDK